MKEIKIKCPAKINLDLKIINKRPDGFHNIESTMQTIGLYDILTITTEPARDLYIKLSGNSKQIPYDERNIAFKAADLFFKTLNQNSNVQIRIEKNIPVAAGMAGGSTDAAGVIFGLNEIFDRPLDRPKLHELCAVLGSDLNFCLEGGCQKAFSRGEILEKREFIERNVSLIKPLNLGISAKEAYEAFARKITGSDIGRESFANDLEWAVSDNYKELRLIKDKYPNAVMTGSGSTYYAFDTEFSELPGFWIRNNLKTVNRGVKTIL